MPEIWTPLESNPDVINNYAKVLGLDTSKIQFYDVMSTEDWALDMVPKPVHAVILVYPVKDASETRSKVQHDKIISQGQHVASNTYFMKQTVPNACGTIAVLHGIGNLTKDLFNIALTPDSYLDKFFKNTKGAPVVENTTDSTSETQIMSPDSIAQFLRDDSELDSLHTEASNQGQSEVPDEDEPVINHFICLSHVNGSIYEFDGRKAFPINHGELTALTPGDIDESSFLKASIEILQNEFMKPDPDEVRFTFMALCSVPEE